MEQAQRERKKGIAALFVLVGIICLLTAITGNIWFSLGLPILFSGGLQIYVMGREGRKEKK